MNPEPRFSVLIINYNSEALVRSCVDSVAAHVRSPFEVLVLDNGSSPEDVKLLREDNRIRLVETGSNMGFGRANNLGAQLASSPILVLLNPDTIIDSNVFEELTDHLESRPETGLTAPLLIQEDGTFQNSWNTPCGLAWEFVRGHYLQRMWYRWNWMAMVRKHGTAVPWDVGCVVGACMVVRKEEFLALGGFDPDFFMNGEDEDLCDRIRHSGKKVQILPWTKLHHHEGGVQQLDWSRYMQHRFDAFRLVIGKRFSGWRRIVAQALWWEAVLARLLIGFLILRGAQRSRLRGYWLALRAAWNA